MTADSAIGHEPRSTSLTTEQTDPTQTEVSQLEMTVLVDEQVVRLEITADTLISAPGTNTNTLNLTDARSHAGEGTPDQE